jgi:hypothetical protein
MTGAAANEQLSATAALLPARPEPNNAAHLFVPDGRRSLQFARDNFAGTADFYGGPGHRYSRNNGHQRTATLRPAVSAAASSHLSVMSRQIRYLSFDADRRIGFDTIGHTSCLRPGETTRPSSTLHDPGPYIIARDPK